MRKIYLGITLLLCSIVLQAQPSGWTHVRGILINEQSGATLTNYQFKLYFDTQTEINAGRMLASGDDIRFGTHCTGDTLLSYWIEGPMNDDSTVIWVNVPSIPANGQALIQMFYGNPSAPAASAVDGTFVGPHSASDSVASGSAGGVGNSQRGFRFAPTQDILVTSFGKREPTGTTRYVTLFNFTTQAILSQIQVSGPAAQYSYGALPAPMWLTQGTQYSLQLFQGGSDGYYFGSSSQIGQHLTYYDMKYCNSCTQNTFPTNTLTNYHYGYPDLWYYTRQIASTAPTYSVLPLGHSLPVTAGTMFGCLNDTLTLSSTVLGTVGASNCVWSPAAGLSSDSVCNPTTVVLGNASYLLTVTDSLGCWGADSAHVMDGTPTVTVQYDTTTICMGDTLLFVGMGADLYTWGPGGSLSGVTGDSVWAFPSVTTTYALQGTDTATGCAASDTFVVEVSAVAVNTVIGPVHLCEGDTAVLMVSGADIYHWSPGTDLSDTTGSSVMAWPSTSITYTITGWDTVNGCQATGQYQVDVHANPVVAFSLPNHFCDIDPPTQLTGGTPTGGVYSGTGVSSGMFAPGTAGVGSHVITYTVVDGFGCEGSDTALAVVDVCIGVSPSLSVDFTVYPNPSAGMFTVSMGTNPESTTFQVYNMMGQVVRGGNLMEGKNMLDLSGASSGLYILSIETAGLRRSFNLEIRR